MFDKAIMASELYGILVEKGLISLRHRMRDGSKIGIYDRSKLDASGELNPWNLEHYRDNRDRLPEDFA